MSCDRTVHDRNNYPETRSRSITLTPVSLTYKIYWLPPDDWMCEQIYVYMKKRDNLSRYVDIDVDRERERETERRARKREDHTARQRNATLPLSLSLSLSYIPASIVASKTEKG